MLSNLHLSQKQPNKLALFAFGHKIPKLILETSSESSVCGNKVMDLVARYLNESDDLGSLNGNDLAFALSNALCYFNKLQKLDASPNMSGRLCVFSSSHDFSRHYYAFINCAFAAQKLVCSYHVSRSVIDVSLSQSIYVIWKRTTRRFYSKFRT